MERHSTILFGGYNWLVLDVQASSALLIIKDIIEQHPYHNISKYITWADCSLREYLNNEFLERFDDADKSKIIPVTNINLC